MSNNTESAPIETDSNPAPEATESEWRDPSELEELAGTFKDEEAEAVDEPPQAEEAAVEDSPAAEPEEAVEGEETPAPEAVTEETSPESEPVPAEAPAEEPPLKARRLASFMKKEKARLAKEADLKAREEAIKSKEAAAPPSLRDIKDSAELSKAIKALGYEDPTELANALYEAKLAEEGLLENLPPETKAAREMREMAKKLEALEKQQVKAEEVVQQARQQAKLEAKLEEITNFSTSIPAEMEYLQREAQRSGSAEIVNAMAALADAAFQQTGSWPSSKDLAAALEESIREQVSIHLPKNSNPAPTPNRTPKAPSKTQSKSLGGADLKQKPTKPARKEFLTPDELLEASKNFDPTE